MQELPRWDKRSNIVLYLFSVAALFLLWDGLSLLLRNPALPRPYVAARQFAVLFPRELWGHLLASLYRVAVSVALGLATGVPLGIFVARREHLDRFLAPFIYLLYPIPKIALLPVIIAIFKLGDASKIFVITIVIFFQILVTTRDAAKKVPPQTITSVLALGARGLDLYRHVIIPACLPDVFTAVRISLGTAIAVLFFAESFATTEGLGYFVIEAWSRIDYPAMFAGILALAGLGFFLFLLCDLLPRLACPWLFS